MTGGSAPAGLPSFEMPEIIRDPLWDNIELDATMMSVVDTAPMQRLRYIRQLGHAFLVYPGATHTRFEHALGAYHLTARALAILGRRGELEGIAAVDQQAVLLAALLHDVGHYPFSHGLEEAGFAHHEELGVARLRTGELRTVLDGLGGPALISDIGALIQGRSTNPLQGLISGTLDLDKVDYLSRDARGCGVSYGTLDVDRMLATLTLVRNDAGQLEVGILDKGISALETMLFGKYQMYRNVYWHHAVRSATCMFKRAVRSAVATGRIMAVQLADATDGALMERLLASEPTGLARAVHERRLYKRALDLPASDVPANAGDWIDRDPDLLEQVENALAKELDLSPGELLLDYPARSNMLAVDLALKTRDGRTERLTGAGRAGQLGLPRIAAELYQSARRLRIFTARSPRKELKGIVGMLTLPEDEILRRLQTGAPLQ
ncbi:MAG: HD domain-containing protein [Gemmatimonadales bacterium]|nr:HD domain-containing protein [Gemmatimonadales bacterium]